jgi:hypothetical protein
MKHRKYRNGAIVLFTVAVGLFVLAAMAMLFAVLSMQNLSLFSAVGKFSDIANTHRWQYWQRYLAIWRWQAA